MTQILEKIYDNGKHKIKYLFHQGNYAPEKLIIVFSAFPPEGKRPTYQYIKCISEIDANKLYILDTYGPNENDGGSCYYLGKNRDFTVESATMELINIILKEQNINKKNVIALGTSKGGWASLYFGIKHGFGTVIAGAPQYYLGDFLNRVAVTKKYVRYISGGESIADVEYLNNILPELVKSTKELPDIYLHVGSGEFHYTDHVQHLINDLERRHAKYYLDLPNYDSHGDVGIYFIPFLVPLVQRLLEKRDITRFLENHKQPNVYSVFLNWINPKKAGTNIICKIEATGENIQYAWYLYKDGERVDTFWYKNENYIEFTPMEEGKYKFIGFAKDSQGNIDFKYSKEIIIFGHEIHSVTIETPFNLQVGETISCSTNATGDNLEYAWYIFKNDNRIQQVPYSKQNLFEWKLPEPGTYKILGFVKNKQGIIESKYSNEFNVNN